jgi:hypothetical protein
MKIRLKHSIQSQQYMSQIQSEVVSTQLIVMTSLLRDVRKTMSSFIGICSALTLLNERRK